MSKDKKTTKKQNVEIVDISYKVLYEKIYNNTLHYLYKNFKTYNAAKRFRTRLKCNPKVRDTHIIACRDDIDF